MTVLTEANDLINGPRAEAYGPAERNLGRIAEQWNLYILQRYGVNLCMNAEDVCWMMADLKKCRQMHNAMRENVKDAAGYLGLIEQVTPKPVTAFDVMERMEREIASPNLCADCGLVLTRKNVFAHDMGDERCGNFRCNMFMRKVGT